MIYPPEQDSTYPRLFKGLQDLVRPFVYRRYLDFGVIAAIRELHGQIQQEAEKEVWHILRERLILNWGEAALEKLSLWLRCFS